nr:probable serine/threonine protein kinase IRE [Tanacetum cinerariifolium]
VCPFFKNINWDTLAKQKATFIPSAEALDTSYFMSRYIWNPDEEHIDGGSDFDDMSEASGTSSGDSSNSNMADEEIEYKKESSKLAYISPCHSCLKNLISFALLFFLLDSGWISFCNRKPQPGGGLVVTAHGRKYHNQTGGYSFQGCNITAADDLKPVIQRFKVVHLISGNRWLPATSVPYISGLQKL